MNEDDIMQHTRQELAREKLARRILGVSDGATLGQIKKAFWLLALEHHPDKKIGDPDAERRFKNIVNAYNYLVKGSRGRVLLEEDAPHGLKSGSYSIENDWGYFLWWRDSFFNERPDAGSGTDGVAGNYFLTASPSKYDAWYRSPVGKRIASAERRAIAAFLRGGSGKRLLDVGCGTGYFSSMFRELGYATTGVDISERFLDYAQKHHTGPVVLARGEQLPFENGSFDVATAIALLEFVAHPEDVVREMLRVARERIVLLFLNPASSLNRTRREKKKGVFASARLWEPRRAVRFLRGLIPAGREMPIRRKAYEDFYVLSCDIA